MRAPIPPGTLDMLVLHSVARGGELHGFEIAEAIRRTSADVLQVEEGSLYPALQRLMVKGWVRGEWGRRRKSPRPLLPTHTRWPPAAARGIEEYRRVSHAIALILQPL